jgi:hypothetical protein
MIIEIKDAKTEKPRPFPKMMITEDGLIVYFTDSQSGIVVRDNSKQEYGFGCLSCAWHSACFTDFKGVIELRNDWVDPLVDTLVCR